MEQLRENKVTFRLNWDELDKLDALVKKYQTKRSTLIRTLILNTYEEKCR